MNDITTATGIDWSETRFLPAFPKPRQLEVYDVRALPHEVQLSIANLVGLINRPEPKVYLVSRDDDLTWLQQIFSAIPQQKPDIVATTLLEQLVTQYRSLLRGIIIYDPDFMDSINIASTMAGQQNALVISPTQAGVFRQAPFNLPILADLRKQHWSNRLEAYQWAWQQFINQATPHLVAGLDPTIAVGIRPFLVATRTFIYWLDSRSILPDLLHGWLSERTLMRQIFQRYPAGAIHLGWFIDEGSGVNLTTRAALPVLASDFFNNLEVWTAVQPDQTDQTPVPDPSTIQALAPSVSPTDSGEGDIYVSFTISDGDNLQYDQHRMAQLWQDPARGSVPIGWTISPALLQAAPALANYYIRTASANDEFIAGPSGAGYMFPSHWPADKLDTFLQRTGELMQLMHISVLEALDTDRLHSIGLGPLSSLAGGDMSFTNEEIQKRYIQALVPYGLKGLLSGAGRRDPSWTVLDTIPIYRNLGLASSVDQAVDLIAEATRSMQQRPLYLNIYLLAWNMGPSEVSQVAQRSGSGYRFVKPGELLERIAARTIGKN